MLVIINQRREYSVRLAAISTISLHLRKKGRGDILLLEHDPLPLLLVEVFHQPVALGFAARPAHLMDYGIYTAASYGARKAMIIVLVIDDLWVQLVGISLPFLRWVSTPEEVVDLEAAADLFGVDFVGIATGSYDGRHGG